MEVAIAIGVPIIMANNIHNDSVEIFQIEYHNGEYQYYMSDFGDGCIKEGFYKNNILVEIL